MVAGGACMVAGGMRGCRGACMVARGHAWLLGGVHRIRQDTVNEWAVRILLECILILMPLLIENKYAWQHSVTRHPIL